MMRAQVATSSETLLDLFEAHAARDPAAPAVAAGAERIGYGELNTRANRLAHRLIALGAGPETVVAIMAERSTAMLVTVLAVLKAGAAYVPLDPLQPALRMVAILRDANPALVLASAALRDHLPATVECVVLDAPETRAALARERAHDPRDEDRTAPLLPYHPAYVIYTSGSTGEPKGVVVTHAGIPNLARAFAGALGITPASRVLQLHTFAFDASVGEYGAAFATGAALVFAPDDARSGAALYDVLRAQRVTHGLFPPAVLATLPATDELALAGLLVGGEVVPEQLVAPWLRGRVVRNVYGPTETTVLATISEPLSSGVPPPIGFPLEGMRAYVLDARLQPVAAGVTGELYLAGPGLARGYLGRPGATAERFVADPCAVRPGTRMYRTGDLVRRLDDGALLFVARADGQLKIRGFRVELGEIEAALGADPAVAAAVVVARDDPGQARRLVAYAVSAAGAAPDAAQLRRALSDRVPDYMLPAQFVFLASLPLNANGKVDRRALPAPGREHQVRRLAHTAAEAILCAVLADVLHAGGVGLDDNFFALGGDSITAAAVVARARAHGLQITMRDVFGCDTVEALAAAAVAARDTQRARDEAEPAPDRALPLAPLADELVRLYARSLPGGYPLQISVELTGAFDAERMHAAFAALLRRHANLRAAIRYDGVSPPAQVFPASGRVPWRTVDLSADGGALAAFLDADFARPVALADPPLLRAAAVRIAPDRHVLAVSVDHVVLDGWSVPLLFEELFALYRSGGDADAPPLARPYTAYLDWLARQDRSAARAAWREYLAGVPVTSMFAPHDAAAPSISGSVEIAVPPELSGRLDVFARAHRFTLNTVMQGLWALLLGEWTGRDDVVFGVMVSGRPADLDGVERTIGTFANTVPLRVRLAPGRPFATLLAEIQSDRARMLSHQFLSPNEIRCASGTALAFDTLLVFQNFPRGAQADPGDGARVTGARFRAGGTTVPLDLVVYPGEPVRVRLEYESPQVDRPRAEALGARLVELIGAVTGEPV